LRRLDVKPTGILIGPAELVDLHAPQGATEPAHP
jgi:hypothetical protein